MLIVGGRMEDIKPSSLIPRLDRSDVTIPGNETTATKT